MQFTIGLVYALLFTGFEIYNYRHLPVVDFMNWKVGRQMNAKPEQEQQIYLTFKNKTTSEKQEYLSPNYPWSDTVWMSQWEFVEQRVEGGNNYIGFTALDQDGDDVTEMILNTKNLLMFTSHDMGKITDREWEKITNITETASNLDYEVIWVTANTQQEMVEYKKNTSGTDCVSIKVDEPSPAGEVTTHSAENAFLKVLAYAGASLCRDNVDERYANEAETGTATYTGSVTHQPGIIDLVSDVNGYTEENFGTGTRPDDFDTDKDGIPNEWEIANGLNPNDANDGPLFTIDTEKGWYTNLEVYLNSLVEDIMRQGNDDALESLEEYYPQFAHDSGIESISASALAKEEYYTLEGKKISHPSSGVVIRRQTFKNGQVKIEKIIL